MKKRIIAWAVLLSVCAAALGLWCSAAAGKTARTLPCEDEGLILSITTFDGKSESKPFLLRTLHRQIVPEHQYRGRAAEGHRGLHGTAR